MVILLDYSHPRGCLYAWFWFTFSWWPVKLSFFYVFISHLYIFGDIYSNPLLIFKLGCLLSLSCKNSLYNWILDCYLQPIFRTVLPPPKYPSCPFAVTSLSLSVPGNHKAALFRGSPSFSWNLVSSILCYCGRFHSAFWKPLAWLLACHVQLWSSANVLWENLSCSWSVSGFQCPITKNLVVSFSPVEPLCTDQTQISVPGPGSANAPGEKMARPSVHLRKTSSSEIPIQLVVILLPVFLIHKNMIWVF